MEDAPAPHPSEPPKTNIELAQNLDEIIQPETPVAPEEPTIKISRGKWDTIEAFVKTQDKTGTLQLGREFDLSDMDASAVFEELQARGIVTKHYVPAPGKGAYKHTAYDNSRYGGYMVLVNPDDSSKRPDLPPDPHDERTPHPEMGRVREHGRVRRFLGRTTAGRTVVTDAENYSDLWSHRVWAAGHTVSGQREAEIEDARLNGEDRKYAKAVFDRNNDTWKRTVPRLEIVEDSAESEAATGEMSADAGRLSPAEKEIDQEIQDMRDSGMADGDIKVTLLKQYHPDRPDGGNIEKAKYVTSFFMRKPGSAPHTRTKTHATPKAETTHAKKEEGAEKKKPTPADPLEITLRYVSGEHRTDEPGEPFPSMSEESIAGMLVRNLGLVPKMARQLGLSIRELDPATRNEFQKRALDMIMPTAKDIFAKLQEGGVVDTTYTPGEGFAVLYSAEEFQNLLKEHLEERDKREPES